MHGSVGWAHATAAARARPGRTRPSATSPATPTLVVDAHPRGAAAGAHLVAFPEMVLTGYPVEDLALRPSFVGGEPARPCSASPRRSPTRASATCRASSATSTAPTRGDDRLGRPRGAPQNAAAVLHRRRGRRPLRQAPPAQLRRVRRVPLLRAGRHACRSYGSTASTSRSRSARTSGRTAARSRRCARRAPGCCWCINGSPYERNKDDVRLELCARRAREAGVRARLRQHGRRPGRAGLRRRLARRRRRRRRCWRAPRSSRRSCCVVDLELPAARPGGATGDACDVGRASRVPAVHPDRAATRPSADRLTTRPRSMAALRDRAARLRRARTASARCCSGCPAASTRRSSRRIACDAIGADNVYGVSMPSEYSSDHSGTTPPSWPDRTGLHFRTVPIARWSTRTSARCTLTGLAEENLQARVRGDDLDGASPTRRATWCSPPATRASWPSATPRSTATPSAASRPSRTCRRPLVWALARWRNDRGRRAAARTPPIPESSIDKPPSAELRPGQLDTDSLPDYAVLDGAARRLRGAGPGRGRAGRRRLRRGARRAGAAAGRPAPSTSVASTRRARRSRRADFGRDRRLPITNRWREQAVGTAEFDRFGQNP